MKDEKDIACENEKKKEKPDIETRIYNILNTAEKIAVKLAQINHILKKSAKKKKKKNKKLGKIDKKTGTLILKGQKKQKAAKKNKKYKPPKKK
jgi:hypothetical protein